MSLYILRISPFFWVIMQGKPKVEETAPGVATGMILSLRERYYKIQNDFYYLFMLSVVRLHHIMFKPKLCLDCAFHVHVCICLLLFFFFLDQRLDMNSASRQATVLKE